MYVSAANKSIIDFFVKNPRISVIVGDESFDCREGTPTTSGWYKNGWTAEIIDNRWIKILVYTSNRCVVNIEERFLFKIIPANMERSETYKIMKHEGWDQIDLLTISKKQFGNDTVEYMDMLKALYERNK